MKRRLATIIMTMTLATTLVACKNNTDADANVNTGTDSELSTEATTEESDESESTEADTEETLMPAETEETESMNTDASEETTSTTEEDTSEEDTSEEETESEETESEEVKETESEEASKEENTVSKKENTSKKEEVKKEEPVQKEEPKKEEPKKEETPSNTEVNNTPAPEVSTPAPAPAPEPTPAPAPAPTPAPEPACTHPQTYIKSGMHLRTESLGGGCVREIEAAEDICLTCGAVVRSYERVGQEGHANMKRISGDAKAPTCTEDGYDNTVTACDCGGYVNTNNSTYPAHGHAFNTYCTGELSEDETKVKYISKCPACDLIEAEWWE